MENLTRGEIDFIVEALELMRDRASLLSNDTSNGVSRKALSIIEKLQTDAINRVINVQP